jgi:integrase
MSAGHIRQRGKSSWELKFDAGRDPATGQRKIQYHSFKGAKREARIKLAELIAAVAGGSYVEPSKITVGGYVLGRVDQWAAGRDITPRTAQRYRELASSQIAPHLGGLRLQKIRPADIEAWHTTLLQSGRKDGKGGLSARTIGHAHRVLSKALDDAVRHGLLTSNPARLEKAPRLNGSEIVIIEEERVGELIAKLRGLAIEARAITAYGTGLRLSELLALRWADVDLDGARTIYVRQALEETKAGIRFKQPKTKAGLRDVTLPDMVVETLRAHRQKQLKLRLMLGLGKLPADALVFPSEDRGPQSPGSVSSKWSIVAARIGMPEISFHALRHTHASQLIAAGIDVVTISRRLGHATPNVTLQIYAHLFRKRDDKAAAAINDAINGALARPVGL